MTDVATPDLHLDPRNARHHGRRRLAAARRRPPRPVEAKRYGRERGRSGARSGRPRRERGPLPQPPLPGGQRRSGACSRSCCCADAPAALEPTQRRRRRARLRTKKKAAGAHRLAAARALRIGAEYASARPAVSAPRPLGGVRLGLRWDIPRRGRGRSTRCRSIFFECLARKLHAARRLLPRGSGADMQRRYPNRHESG